MGRKSNLEHYVNNLEFLQLLQDYKESDWTDRKTYNKIGEIFLKIAIRKLNSGNWRGYSQDYLEEMRSQALLWMCRKVKLFDRNVSSNPFAYFSEIAENQYKLFMKMTGKRNDNVSVINYLENLEDIDGGISDE